MTVVSLREGRPKVKLDIERSARKYASAQPFGVN